jgi:hypothetical protein
MTELYLSNFYARAQEQVSLLRAGNLCFNVMVQSPSSADFGDDHPRRSGMIASESR